MMNRNRIRYISVSMTAAVLLVLLYCTIFCFSAQDADESGNLSRSVAEKCVEIFNDVSGKNWSKAVMDAWAAYWEHPIRKLAHFSEYTCMGVLVYILWRPWKKRDRSLYLLVGLWVLLSAAMDEFHQLFVSGRHGSVADVLLDTCGGIFGIAICVLLEKMKEYLLERNGRRKMNRKNRIGKRIE